MLKIAVIGWRNFLLVNNAITEHCRKVYSRLVEKGRQFIIFVKKVQQGLSLLQLIMTLIMSG
jgi:hypothetical protein